MAVLMVRMEATADDSLAAMRARSKFGIAIAAMIRMIATTISSSISEKPFCLRIKFSLVSFLSLFVWSQWTQSLVALHAPCHTRQLLSFIRGSMKRFLFNRYQTFVLELARGRQHFGQNASSETTIPVSRRRCVTDKANLRKENQLSA